MIPRLVRLLSVATGPFLAAGCAVPRTAPPPAAVVAAVPGTISPPAPVVTEVPGTITAPAPIVVDVPGTLTTHAGRPGFVVGAPHGTSDVRTAEMALEIARRTGFGVVVARGFTLESETSERAGRRYQVNRPFEGVPGRPAREETASDGARAVYDAYERRVREAAQGPLALYVEIHGNNRGESASQIEIATVGIDHERALRLRTLLELIRDAHLRAAQTAPRLAVLVEPVDIVRYSASAAKRSGILRLPERALHIELPKGARTDFAPLYTAILSDFLREAAALFAAP